MSLETVKRPDIDTQGHDYLVAAIRVHNAKGEHIITEEEKDTLFAAFQMSVLLLFHGRSDIDHNTKNRSSDEEKGASLNLSPDDFLQFVELVRESIKFADEAAELLRLTQVTLSVSGITLRLTSTSLLITGSGQTSLQGAGNVRQ